MTLLSVFRSASISKDIRIPTPLTRKRVLNNLLIGALTLVLSISAFIIPLFGRFEDYFVNGVYHGPDNSLFVGAPRKQDHADILQAYYGDFDTSSLTWKLARQLISGMFSQDYSGVPNKKVQFYGNDAVCVFKYLATKEDPQFVFVWVFHAMQLICFLIISMSYIRIGRVVSFNSRIIESNNSNAIIAKRNANLQQKVALIIFTDFVSWIPFIFVCILHSAEVMEATTLYFYTRPFL